MTNDEGALAAMCERDEECLPSAEATMKNSNDLCTLVGYEKHGNCDFQSLTFEYINKTWWNPKECSEL